MELRSNCGISQASSSSLQEQQVSFKTMSFPSTTMTKDDLEIGTGVQARKYHLVG